MTLRKKLIICFLVLTIALGSCIGVFSYMNAKELVLRSKEEEMLTALNKIDISVNSTARQAIRIGEEICRLVQDENSLTFYEEETAQWENTDSYKTIAEGIYRLSDFLDICSDVVVADTEGNVLYRLAEYRGDEADSSYQNRRLPGSMQTAMAVVKKGTVKKVWIGPAIPEYRASGVGSIALCLPVHGETKEDVTGFVFLELDTEQLRPLMQGGSQFFRNQYTFILDGQMQVVAANKNMDRGWRDTLIRNMDPERRMFEFRWNGERYFVCRQYNGLTGWDIYSVISKGDFFPQLLKLRRQIFFLVIFFVAMAMAGAFVIAYRITQPVLALSKAMLQVEAGNFDVHVEHRGRDEVAGLIHSFHFMVEKIRYLIEEVYKQKIAWKTAQLKALQAQINPHFLYNTLDSINWMLIEKEEYDVSDVIVALGDILRYSLRGTQQFALLRDELHYAKAYLCIQQNRLEERLTTDVYVEESAYDCLVPRLILQPIIENAVLHGTEGHTGTVDIVVRVCIVNEQLMIEVRDTGRGMTENELEKCRKFAFEDREDSQIGMKNVHERLKLCFGSDYSMRIESEPWVYTEVTILIPARREEGASCIIQI